MKKLALAALMLAAVAVSAQAQSTGSTAGMFGRPSAGGGFGRSYYGTDTRAACALYFQRYGKRCGKNGLPRPVRR
jgi:hypothetical protein